MSYQRFLASLALGGLCLVAMPGAVAGVSEPGGSGWITIAHFNNLGIYLPVTLNGTAVEAQLWNGPTEIDTAFAASHGINADSVSLTIGNLRLDGLSMKPADIQSPLSNTLVGKPLVVGVGDTIFDRYVVDIDLMNRRVAFFDPSTFAPPAATAVSLKEQDGSRVVQASVNGVSKTFELELGNMIGPLMVTPEFAQEQRLLDVHPVSQRLSGHFTETIVSIDHLGFAGVDFPSAPIALIPESQLPPRSITGGIGLPVLEKFHLIVDYPHNRLFALPYANASAIIKDRLGLVVRPKDDHFVVAFVSPKSPAANAGFKKGDEIDRIDGKELSRWPIAEIVGLQMTAVGTVHVFSMLDGTTRSLTANDFF